MTKTIAQTKVAEAPLSGSFTTTATILFTALMGLGLIMVAGHVQAAALHDAAHDMRHATGFPCH